MLCPEVWNFKAPKCAVELSERKGGPSSPPVIAQHYFNHSVSLFHPRAMNYPDSNFVADLLQNTGYWKVKRLSLAELIDKEFIAKFVKEGEVTLLSVGARIDTDDVVAVTPSGFLVLNLLRSTYQGTGLEGKPSYFERSKKEATRFA